MDVPPVNNDDLVVRNEGPILFLKSGAPVNGIDALAEWVLLHYLFKSQPPIFDRLRLAAEKGERLEGDKLDPCLNRFIDVGTGKIRALTTKVLDASIVATENGRDLVGPFRVDSEDEKRRVQEVEELFFKNMERAANLNRLRG
ncbi:MAG: hypothetical protein ACJ8C4_07095 [Gemmataceae bacterium]